MINSVIILQPPLVQLNGPYPSGAYLAAFFRNLMAEGKTGISTVRWIDASNLFFHYLFSSSGLTRLFSLCSPAISGLIRDAEASGGTEAAFQLRRFLSLEKRWIAWIDTIVSILCGGDRELCHSFVRSPYAPRGPRMDAFFAALETEPTADDARILATLALEDIGDFIVSCFDSEFSLVRYAESIAASESKFERIEAELNRPMVVGFLDPMLASLWADIKGKSRPDGKILFCISVPFPGCLVNALAMARSLRLFFADRAVISMGGGYVNTELRNCTSEKFFSYIDYLSFDRGYGAYADFFERERAGTLQSLGRRLYCPADKAEYEDKSTVDIIPDYEDIDFSRYPRLADNPNPMHRLWSDGAWIKAYLAHGCYWHRCSFCDVSLDYICGYRLLDIPRLYAGLRSQARAKGVHGIHLVDEASPPRALRDFALENLKAGCAPPRANENSSKRMLSFWGNIRFEKTFTRDLADFLCAGGLTAVSGGIEIASPEGFKAVDKGIDLENLVSVCAAFKEAGVLVHAYLIYGYWTEDAQGVIDTVEVMRQLFSAGLVDSAFWHKFVLTRHSRVYAEWKAGKHGEALAPIDKPGDFADNDLRFIGEEDSKKYTGPLECALQAWMAGDGFDTPVKKWFPYTMPSPRIEAGLIDTYIALYEKRRNSERKKAFDNNAVYFWTASVPVSDGQDLIWWHLDEEIRLTVEDQVQSLVISAMKSGAPSDNGCLSKLDRNVFCMLRTNGLSKISPL